MNVPVLTFFNNKGGVGKTSLVYHLSWMYSILGKRVLAADLDPQTNLTASFMKDEEIEEIWNDNRNGTTIFKAIKPIIGVGDLIDPVVHKISSGLYLIPGDIQLSSYEDSLSEYWPKSLDEKNLYRPMRILSSFWQVMQKAAKSIEADIILIDIGPNLGAINRSVLVSTDYVVIPLGADLFSLQGLYNLGPAMRDWKASWKKRLDNWDTSFEKNNYKDFQLPKGKMKVIGYLCHQHGIRLERPVKAYDKWINQIPDAYRENILNIAKQPGIVPETDPYCLGTIRHYRSLVPLAQEHRKPIFMLTSADGALGSHMEAVRDAKKDFHKLAIKIANNMEIQIED